MAWQLNNKQGYNIPKNRERLPGSQKSQINGKNQRAWDKDSYSLLLQPKLQSLGRNQSLLCGTQDEEIYMTHSPRNGLRRREQGGVISSDFLFLKPQNGSCNFQATKSYRTWSGFADQNTSKGARFTSASDREPAWMRKESAGAYVERWHPVLDMPTYTPGTLHQPPSISLDKSRMRKMKNLYHEYVCIWVPLLSTSNHHNIVNCSIPI